MLVVEVLILSEIHILHKKNGGKYCQAQRYPEMNPIIKCMR